MDISVLHEVGDTATLDRLEALRNAGGKADIAALMPPKPPKSADDAPSRRRLSGVEDDLEGQVVPW